MGGLRELSLFSGVGGGLLGSRLLGWRTVGAVELSGFCCEVLAARQRDGMLDGFPIWNMDVRDFNFRVAGQYSGLVDVVSAGFPCQPFSVAGKQQAAGDERNMWPATIDCIRVVRPGFVFLENVPGLVSCGYFDRVIGDLTESGYDCRWRVLSAAELGAPHRRARLWVVGYARGRVAVSESFDDGCGGVYGASGCGSDGPEQREHVVWEGDAGDVPDAAKPRRCCDVSYAVGDEFQGFASSGSDGVACGGEGISDADGGGFEGCAEQHGESVDGVAGPCGGDVGGPCDEVSDADEFDGDGSGHGAGASCGGFGVASGVRGGEADVSDPTVEIEDGRRDRVGRRDLCEIDAERYGAEGALWWDVEPGMGRVADGVADRVERLRGLGNGQVPVVVAAAWGLLAGDLSWVD